MQLCLFEDDLTTRFHPLTLTRPVDDLRTGILTLREKWEYALQPGRILRTTRPHLSEVFPPGEPAGDQACTWINARYLPTPDFVEAARNLSPGDAIMDDAVVAAIRLDHEATAEQLQGTAPAFTPAQTSELKNLKKIEHLWDLFLLNGEEIANDIARLQPALVKPEKYSPHAAFEHPERIYVEPGARIEAGAVFIAEKGPIYIGRDAHIMAHSTLRGPVAVGEKSVVKTGAVIDEETTIGPVCKVSGEIHNAIFHSFSNKGHDGFVGNSLIGQWCNFGADTVTSNLKNNYSPITITDWTTREPVETGQQFIGTIMGDHTKTAINTQLNTGTLVGVCCNLFSEGFPPKFVPSFSWLHAAGRDLYKFDKAVDTMRLVMKRRNVELTPAYQRMMQSVLVREQTGG